MSRQKCSGKLVSGVVRFTTATAGAASITRGHVICALGQLISTRQGRSKLLLAPVRALRPGTYTLTIHAGKRIRHTLITIA